MYLFIIMVWLMREIIHCSRLLSRDGFTISQQVKIPGRGMDVLFFIIIEKNNNNDDQ